MKKHELLKFAYDNYPKGTKFISGSRSKEIIESSGVFRISQNESQGTWVTDDVTSYVICSTNGKWVEILKQKIAIKVENEKEFKALMKHYDSKGWHFYNGKSPLELEMVKPIIEFVQGFYFVGNSSEYQIIPFSDFAKEHNIKLPLITSEDGVDLYEDDEFTLVIFYSGKWFKYGRFKQTPYIEPIGFVEMKKFSNDESANKWIEEQKPKRNYLSGGEVYFEIEENSIKFLSKLKETTHAIHFLTKHDLELINNSIQELS